ncbi:IclR family transcriptional regulator [Corynebacterium terpenotabidum]|nr:IclR family transcriptional regulator [Corynebacterium terpenotabidum]
MAPDDSGLITPVSAATSDGTAPDSETAGGRARIAALANGVRVLEFLSRASNARGVTELAEDTGLHKSTVSRILSTLELFSLVEQDPETQRFSLGVGIVTLAGPLLADMDVRKVARPILRDLTEVTGESTALVMWTGVDGVVVEHVSSPKLVKHITPVGTRIFRPHSASTRVLLAEQTDNIVQKYFDNGWGVPEDIFTLLGEVREQGYAVNDGETSPEEWSVAAPIKDYDGACVAALLLSVPYSRVTDAMRDDLPRRTAQAARRISHRLGYPD